MGGRKGCQALFDRLAAQAYSDLRYMGVYAIAFDAYCMQHLERYCRSAKSYAAHLTRLCCGLEYDGNQEIYAAIQKWLNGPVAIEKPQPPKDLGQATIADVQRASSVREHKRLVRDWAESVWEAYATQHELAHSWIKSAFGEQERR